MTSSNLYLYLSVSLLLILGAHGVSTVTDGNYDSTAEWGASSAQYYDFIIVGGGAAGSVLAARLSANWTVLLLEAGGTSHRDLGGDDYVASAFTTDPVTGVVTRDEPWTRIDVPLFFPSILAPTPLYLEYNWNITGAEQGRTLGGSMAHNAFFWQHPTQNNIQKWNITSHGWTYSQFIQYIKKAENFTNSNFTVDPATMGTNGPIQVRKSAVLPPADITFLNAAIAAGNTYQPNFQNGLNITGAGYLAFNIGNNGTSIRQTSALKYLGPIQSRATLTISLHSLVARVLFSTSCAASLANGQPTANGVQYITTVNGRQVKRTAYANNEVILSGSALLTPKILTLSGIGPQAQLNAFGITPVVVNENVGKNIRNHLVYGTAYTGVNVSYPNMFNAAEEELAYAQFGTGMYATAAGIGTTFVEIKTLNSLVDPDISVYSQSTTAGTFVKGFNVVIVTSTPDYSYGTVSLSSRNPLADVIFDPNLNISLNDVNTLVRGIIKVRAIMNQPEAVAVFGPEIFPGPLVSTFAQLQASVRSNTGYIYHYYGSCKMGNAGDSLRVVDPTLRVVGTNNLRVIDSSIIPAAVHSLLQATVVGIAEKGAAMIAADWI